MRYDLSAMSYRRMSPTAGMSSLRQAICHTLLQTFSFSSSWNERLVYRETGTSASVNRTSLVRRRTSGTGWVSVSRICW